MTIDKEKLKALAEAATQGEWIHERFGVIQAGPVIQFANGAGRQQIAMATGADWMIQGEQIANAEFMAAASPATILALLAEIERLESEAMHAAAGAQSDREQRDQLKAELAQMTQFRDNAANHMRRIRAEATKLEKERDALRKDAERYQWLKARRRSAVELDAAFDPYGVPVDEEIDAAMAKEASHG